ncbi:hypothetical protein BGZ60DRAFT_397676 [Tricladium varicosporioides]|nr:hypothetical protein BGZ60DRAFT_397676 [Hymenoscyphus varicosporioides]
MPSEDRVSILILFLCTRFSKPGALCEKTCSGLEWRLNSVLLYERIVIRRRRLRQPVLEQIKTQGIGSLTNSGQACWKKVSQWGFNQQILTHQTNFLNHCQLHRNNCELKKGLSKAIDTTGQCRKGILAQDQEAEK